MSKYLLILLGIFFNTSFSVKGEASSNLRKVVDMTKSAANSENEIEVVRSYFKALQTGNFDLLKTLLADDIIWHQPGRGELSGKYAGKDRLHR